MDNIENRGLRLLALDGGGVRGLSELIILEEIMKRIKYLNKLEYIPRPCDYFDLIGGVGTGGLIALMLGKLCLSIEDAIEAYVQFTKQVFSQKKFGPGGKGGSIFKATEFENAIKNVIKAAKGHADVLMIDQTGSGCPSFVGAVPALNMTHTRLFRTYEVKSNPSYNCMVWEAARATSAIPGLFKRVLIGQENLKEEFLGAGLGLNSPISLVLEEAESLYGPSQPVSCIISIGAGHPGTIMWQNSGILQQLFPIELINVLEQISTDCENTAEQFEKKYKNLRGIYFRLNVEQGMQKVALADWQKLGEIKTNTTGYLHQSRVVQKVDAVINALCNCPKNIAIGELNGPSPTPNANANILAVPLPTAVFIGRDDILSEIDLCFRAGDPKKQHRFVLYGLGGAGKTQIALKYVEKFGAQFQSTYFIDTTTAAGINSCLQNIGQAVNAKNPTAKDGHFWLSHVQKEWLLVFDNADDPQINLQDFFPPCNHGNIIITSRNSACCVHAPGYNYEVSEITHDEAVELLLKTSGKINVPVSDKKLASDIVKELGHLALAVVQAGAYLMQNQGLSLEKYLNSYKKNRARYHTKNLPQTIDNYKTPVYMTWDISHSKLTPIAAQFLQICAYLHNVGISESLFQDANEELHQNGSYFLDNIYLAVGFLTNFCDNDGEWDDFKFREVVQTLGSYSLIQVSGEDTYSIHPLVHAWASEHKTQEMQTYASSCACQILYCASAHRIKAKDFKPCLALTSHLDKVKNINKLLDTEIARVFGTLYYNAQQWTQAELLYLEVWQTRIATLGESHPDTLTSMVNLGETYWALGKYKESAELAVQVLEKRKTVLGETHPDTLISMSHMALINSVYGKWKEAEDLMLHVLKTRRDMLGEMHPDTLSSMMDLAEAYNSKGSAEEAEMLELQVLEARQKIFGKMHLDTLAIMGKLGTTYWKLGKLDKAEEIEVQVMEARKKILGETHQDTLEAMANLSSTYGNLSKWKEAEELGLHALNTKKAILGELHPDTLRSISNLAAVYHSQGKWEEAVELQISVLEARKVILGDLHPDTLISINNLAVTYHYQKKWKEAEELGMQALEGRKLVLGEKHPETLHSVEMLATTYRSQGKIKEAEQLLQTYMAPEEL